MNKQQAKEYVNKFDFAGFEISVKGLGIFVMSEELKGKIRGLSTSRAKEVNKAAWKEKNKQSKLSEKYCNASIAGNLDKHDIAGLRYDVANSVAKETYKVMMGYI